MNVETIDLKVVQATDISVFKTPNGKRKLYMHYFLKMPDGDKYKWQYRWVDHHTDPSCLMDWIAEGRVYIFPSDSEIREMK